VAGAGKGARWQGRVGSEGKYTMQTPHAARVFERSKSFITDTGGSSRLWTPKKTVKNETLKRGKTERSAP